DGRSVGECSIPVQALDSHGEPRRADRLPKRLAGLVPPLLKRRELAAHQAQCAGSDDETVPQPPAVIAQELPVRTDMPGTRMYPGYSVVESERRDGLHGVVPESLLPDDVPKRVVVVEICGRLGRGVVDPVSSVVSEKHRAIRGNAILDHMLRQQRGRKERD